MRIDGSLTKWNDDRGFGFITPTQGEADIFTHVSAFPRDGQRPRIGERLTFEIGTGKDGKKQARNILCPTRSAEKPYRLSEPVRRRDKPNLLGRVIPLGMVIALGAYGYNAYTQRPTPQIAPAVQSSVAAAPSSFHCDGRQHCSQMGSRAEAEYFLRNCPDTKMDGDADGIPCEKDSRF
ncbi:MAG: cold shock domain-containing protein [Thiobacillus sp.]